LRQPFFRAVRSKALRIFMYNNKGAHPNRYALFNIGVRISRSEIRLPKAGFPKDADPAGAAFSTLPLILRRMKL
jgi:hypothetical protein